MNKDNTNYVHQRHADSFYNGKIPAHNYPALHPQLHYGNSIERSMFATREDFANMGSKLNNNVMGNYVTGGNIGKQLNVAAGLKAPGHLPHHNSLRNGGHNDLNVQGTNISMEVMQAQGLLQKQNVGMYHQNPNFNMQNEEFPALPIFRGGIMDYPVEMHPKQQLSDYSLSQLQLQHLPAGPITGFKLTNPYLLPNQQQLSQTVSGQRMSIVQSNNDSRLHSHAFDLLSSTLDVPAHIETGAGGINHLNPVGTVGWSYDENIRRYVPHKEAPVQFPLMQSPDASNIEGRTKIRPAQYSADPYGMLGLLHVIKSCQTTNVLAHGVGIDLTTLGLNLTQPADLHKDFLSPFSEKSVKDYHSSQFVVPECYNAMRAADLQLSCFSRFGLMTLFYIFYSMPKDVAQLYAAHELMNQEWFYHKELRLWLIRAKGTKPLEKTDTYERGTFLFFDPNEWKLVPQANFVLKYESIEKRPALPSQPRRC